MNCHHVQNLISAFIDHELDADEKREFRKHLVACAECNAQFQEIQQLKNYLGSLIPTASGCDSFQIIKTRIISEERITLLPSHGTIWLRRFSLVATCSLIFLLSATVLFPTHLNSNDIAVHSSTTIIPVSTESFSLDQPFTVYQTSLNRP